MSTIIGLFEDQNQAEKAIEEIRDAGISQEDVSIVAKEGQVNVDEDQEDATYFDQDLTTGAATGGALGGLAGLMAGAGALAIPGIGPIIAAGPIAAGLTGVAAGGLAGSLVDMGIPEERGKHYEEEVKRGRILATIETDQDNINDIASYLRRNGAQDVETH